MYKIVHDLVFPPVVVRRSTRAYVNSSSFIQPFAHTVECQLSEHVGPNPVRNYEYSVSLKLSTQRFWGVTDILRTTPQAGSQRRDDNRRAKLEKAKPPMIEHSKIHTCRAVFSCNCRHGMCALIRKQ